MPPGAFALTTKLNRIATAFAARVRAGVAQYPRTLIFGLATLLVSGTGMTFALARLDQATPPLAVHQITEDLPTPAGRDTLADLSLRLYRSDTTRSNDTADTLLKRLGVFDPQAAAFLRADALVQQNLMGHAGRNVTAEADNGNALLQLTARWSPEDDGMFKRLRVEKTAQGYVSSVQTLPLRASSRLAGGTISSSLFAATDAAHIPDAIAIQLAEIFSGDIDFQRALRKGDRFSVSYETLEGDGEPLRAGRVLSAEFVNAGKSHQAVWFQPPVGDAAATPDSASSALTHGGYYTLAGESLRRTFLASPLQFTRITSGFQMRFHPILKLWKAHLGVDYAAALGTPVRTVGDGVVEFAGVQNGYGNVVMIRHGGRFETVYAHLSKINVRVGEHVTQGENIALSGATGWATGPHLHFEFRVDGVHRDPQTIARNSEATPVSAALRPLFDRVATQARSQLSSAAQWQMADVD